MQSHRPAPLDALWLDMTANFLQVTLESLSGVGLGSGNLGAWKLFVGSFYDSGRTGVTMISDDFLRNRTLHCEFQIQHQCVMTFG